MALRDVTIRLGLNPGPFVAGVKTAQAASTGLAANLTKTAATGSKSASVLGSSFGNVGIAVGLAGATMVKAAADFDQGMSNVKATGSDAVANIGKLRQAAIEAGAATKYSATEAAGGVEALAKAGVSSADILGGGLTGALNLAAAGNLDVAGSAEAAASAMNQFGLKGKDVPHIADLLAAGAGKAQGEVSDMAMALNQAGLVANTFGYSIEETTGVLAEFAASGLTGSDAGTSLKTMLIRLAAPTDVAKAAMAQYGIVTRDANGDLLNASAIAGNLQTAFAGVDAAERDAALATIFGQDAIRGASILYQDGAVKAQGWADAVNDGGFAAETAATKMDNLKGDLETLKGSLDTLFIQGGEGSQGDLRMLTQDLTGITNAIGKLKQVGGQGGPFAGLLGSPLANTQRQIAALVALVRGGGKPGGGGLPGTQTYVTKFATIGAEGSIKKAVAVARAANLTPKRVESVLRLLGWSPARIKQVTDAMKKADGKQVKVLLKLLNFDTKPIDRVNTALDSTGKKDPVVDILIHTAQAENSLGGLLGLVQDVDETPAETTVSTDDQATPTIESVLATLAGADGQEAITYITTVKRTITKPAEGGAIPFADGGSWGPRAWGAMSGPGGDTDDRIPAMLSNGEHVLTASDVRMLGGQDAVYRMRAEAQAGYLKFAWGGAVAPTKNQLDIERLEAEQEIARLKDEIKNPPTGTKRSKAETTLLKRQLAEAQARLARIMSGQEGLMHDYLIDRADEAFDLLDLSSRFSQSPWQSGNSSLASWASGRLSKLKAFAAKLVELKRRGMGGMLLSEIAAMGIDEGTRAANSLLSGPASDILSLQRTFDEIQSFQTGIGNFVTGATSSIQVANFQITDWQQGIGQIEMNITNGVQSAMVGAIR